MIRKYLVAGLAALALPGAAFATTVGCTVTSGTVLTSTLGGLGYSIANGIGTSTGGATGVISCPAISTGIGTLSNYQVLATVDYQGGPFGTTSGTSVTEILTIAGGPLNGSSVAAVITGGNSSSAVTPPVPFQIGATLNGATSYAGFQVYVQSLVSAGGPVGGSSGQVVISFDVAPPTNVPLPATGLLLSGALLGLGVMRKRTA